MCVFSLSLNPICGIFHQANHSSFPVFFMGIFPVVFSCLGVPTSIWNLFKYSFTVSCSRNASEARKDINCFSSRDHTIHEARDSFSVLLPFSENAQRSSLELRGHRTASVLNVAMLAVWNAGNLMKLPPIHRKISSFYRSRDSKRKLPSSVTTGKIKMPRSPPTPPSNFLSCLVPGE